MRNRHARCGIRPQQRRRLPRHSVGVRAFADFRPVEIHHPRTLLPPPGRVVVVVALGTRAGQVPHPRAVVSRDDGDAEFDGVRRVRSVVPSHGGVPSRRIAAMPAVGAVDPVLTGVAYVDEDAAVAVVAPLPRVAQISRQAPPPTTTPTPPPPHAAHGPSHPSVVRTAQNVPARQCHDVLAFLEAYGARGEYAVYLPGVVVATASAAVRVRARRAVVVPRLLLPMIAEDVGLGVVHEVA